VCPSCSSCALAGSGCMTPGLASLYVLRDPITHATTNAWASAVASGAAAASDAAADLSGGSFMGPLSWAVPGRHRFNCSGNAEDRGEWPLAQRRWCCKKHSAECSVEAKAKSRASMLSTTSRPDVVFGSTRDPHMDCKGQQSQDFRDWCCSHQGVLDDCHHGPPPPRPAGPVGGSAAALLRRVGWEAVTLFANTMDRLQRAGFEFSGLQRTTFFGGTVLAAKATRLFCVCAQVVPAAP